MAKQAGNYYGNASSTVSSTHKDNMQRFHSSRETYLSKVHDAVEVPAPRCWLCVTVRYAAAAEACSLCGPFPLLSLAALKQAAQCLNRQERVCLVVRPGCAASKLKCGQHADTYVCLQYVKAHGLVGTAKSTADSLLHQIDVARKSSEKQATFATEKVKEAWTNFQQLPIGALPQ